MTVDRWARLARYNSERARGLVHTAEYAAEMAVEQAAFNREHRPPDCEVCGRPADYTFRDGTGDRIARSCAECLPIVRACRGL